MNLSALATNALATTRSTFKGLAEAAVATGDHESAARKPAPSEKVAEKPEVRAESVATTPKGIRLGTVLDAYA